ncbi:uncharacterized protein RJT20DRAFT_17108 [Scheffersomyces xylosifermentans]|uniref:uncharacterized protein n=1 Tax=Scheffersomyces xylosifermentans TaxID=1304137 RepID=UPI00315DBAB6
MARKLKGKTIAKKGLKGALARHALLEQSHSKQSKNAEIQKEQQIQKQKSIKSGGGNKKQKKQQQNAQLQRQKGFIPFTKQNRVLLVGEGDFSFAKSIVAQEYIEPENLIATSFDSEKELISKYPNVEETLAELKELGVVIHHQVDGTNLVQSMKMNPSKKKSVDLFADHANLDYIMFNFPHTGRGMKDVDRNIRDHQHLMLGYFKSCKQVFELVNNEAKNDFAGYTAEDDESKKGGRIILSLFEGEPYQSWGVKILARSENYRVERSSRFDWASFPEYHHRRTNSTRDTTKPAAERDARIYIFEKFEKKEKEDTRKKRGNDSDSDDD